jgi:hypothetical protein
MATKTSNFNLQRVLLLFCAIGLIPIALSYGLVPEKTLTPLFDISVDNLNLTHIMRAVMGLYLGQIVFWFMGAFNPKLRRPALYVLTIFMLGLAFGRIISILVDGLPHWLLIVYLVLELTFGIIGLFILNKVENK